MLGNDRETQNDGGVLCQSKRERLHDFILLSRLFVCLFFLLKLVDSYSLTKAQPTQQKGGCQDSSADRSPTEIPPSPRAPPTGASPTTTTQVARGSGRQPALSPRLTSTQRDDDPDVPDRCLHYHEEGQKHDRFTRCHSPTQCR